MTATLQARLRKLAAGSMPGFPRDTCEEAAAELDRLTDLNARALECLTRFTLQCEEMHHERGQQHDWDEPCPVVAHVQGVIDELRGPGFRDTPEVDMCPHGMPLADNVCGPCSQGKPNRRPYGA